MKKCDIHRWTVSHTFHAKQWHTVSQLNNHNIAFNKFGSIPPNNKTVQTILTIKRTFICDYNLLFSLTIFRKKGMPMFINNTVIAYLVHLLFSMQQWNFLSTFFPITKSLIFFKLHQIIWNSTYKIWLEFYFKELYTHIMTNNNCWNCILSMRYCPLNISN